MDKVEKREAVEKLRDQFKKSQAFFLTDFAGIKVDKIQSIRREIKGADGNFQITKNTLTRLALKEVGHEGLLEHVNNQNAIAFAYNDPSPIAKVIKKYMGGDDEAGLELRVGLLGDEVVGKEMLLQLASLPTRDELIAKMIGSVGAPIFSLVNVLHGTLRNFVQVLSAIQRNKSE